MATAFSRRLEFRVDSPTSEEIDLHASESTPPRKRSEMARHLLRLGLRQYRQERAQEAQERTLIDGD